MKDKVVKQWVEKTKQALLEEERKQEIVKNFKEIFGIEPDRVWWDACKTLTASAQFKEFDEELTILDRKVTEINFIMYEEEEEVFDPHWKFETGKHTKHWHHGYRWTKRIGGYKAIVEIFAKIS
jgi:hypothetical protein